MPGILYYGNPSGEKNSKGKVPVYHGNMGEQALFEENRFPMPFVCIEGSSEKQYFGQYFIRFLQCQLVHSDLIFGGRMGVESKKNCDELQLLSGPTDLQRSEKCCQRDFRVVH